MQPRLGLALGCLLLVGIAIWLNWPAFYLQTIGLQREFQNAMASGLRAAQAGTPGAVMGLSVATFSYGLVHAAGPGHGKILLGSAALASSSKLRSLALLSLTSALAQSITAIVLVSLLVGGLKVLDSRDAVDLAETWLRPLSYLLFMCIGAVLIWRGVKTLLPLTRHTNKNATGCTHSHGPSLEQLDATASWKQRVVLVLSIAIRPCSGALFLLIVAARLDLFWLGIIGTFAMGLGTATFNTSVAASGFLARAMVQRSHRASLVTTGAALQIAGGVLVIAVSLAFVGPVL